MADVEMKRMVFGEQRIAQLGELLDLADGEAAMGNTSLLADTLAEAEIVISTWGMPKLDAELLAKAPRLKAVFYVAGSVKYFVTDASWDRGIVIQSCWAANAIPVAEFTVAQIVLSLKDYWGQTRRTMEARTKRNSPSHGCYGKRVGIIGAGMIGRVVSRMLKAYSLSVVVYDPYLTEDAARDLGVEQASLAEIFATCHCVSLHAPNIPETKHMVRGEHIRSMMPLASFINTSRGALVDESELVAALKARPDVTVLLDVTDPEPPPVDSEMWDLPNLIISPHIAGAQWDECHRMADYAIEELRRYLAGEPLKYEVTRAMIDKMA